MSATRIQDAISTAVLEHYRLSARTRKLISQANADLYYGPLEDEAYPGFVSACDEIAADLEDIGELWYDADCGQVLESEPEGFEDEDTGEWIEPYLEETYHMERREVIRMIVGRELAPYVS